MNEIMLLISFNPSYFEENKKLNKNKIIIYRGLFMFLTKNTKK